MDSLQGCSIMLKGKSRKRLRVENEKKGTGGLHVLYWNDRKEQVPVYSCINTMDDTVQRC